MPNNFESDSQRWVDAIERIRRHFGFHNAMIAVNSLPSGNAVIEASRNVPEVYVRTAKNYGVKMLALWGGATQIARVPVEEPVVQTRFTGLSDWRGNAFYDEWALPQGLIDQMVVILERSPAMIATLGLRIRKSMPPISDAQIDGMRIIAPHLRRAVIISGLLEPGRASLMARR